MHPFQPRALRCLATVLMGLAMGCLQAADGMPTGEQPRISLPAPCPSLLPGGSERWDLVWSEEFDGKNADLDQRWTAQNGPSTHILCSRWRDNVVMAAGRLALTNRREQRGGQEWTSGSITSKKQFLYGYFECRYRYAAAPATNNSFWLMTTGNPAQGKRFEIDINEGHYPNEIATNIHNWSDFWEENGKKRHHSASRSFRLGSRPEFALTLESPITTRKLRLVGRDRGVIHLREFRAYPPDAHHPDPASAADGGRDHALNLVRAPGTVITASGNLEGKGPAKAADGSLGSEWVSQREGDKWIEFAFPENRTIGHLQFLSGYQDPGKGISGILDDFTVQYDQDGTWQDLSTATTRADRPDLSQDDHLYGLEWTAEELVFYCDGKELRRAKNEFCHSPAPVWLSLAIIPWGGPITPALDGSAMSVDHVRVFAAKPNSP